MSADIKQWQAMLAPRLSVLHGGVETQTEWATMGREFGVYLPRLNIAVGPFATANLHFGRTYDELLVQHGDFLQCLYDFNSENLEASGESADKFPFGQVVHQNWNARCYIAIEIEIENEASPKHLIGGALNAAALGRIGIAIGWTAEKVRAFARLRSYLLYVSRVAKNTYHPINLLVLSPEQLVAAVERFERK